MMQDADVESDVGGGDKPTMPMLFSQALVGEHNISHSQNSNIINKLVI